jgi:hypothetical protein
MSTATVSKPMLWTGRVLSVVPGLMLLLDGVMKIVKPDEVVKQSAEIGVAEPVLMPLGIVLCVSVILYLVPRTSVLGAILLTGYLGGAVATHVIHKDSLLMILVPAIFGAVLWLGLVLRDPRLRRLLPVRMGA